jgi:hypothetical protein
MQSLRFTQKNSFKTSVDTSKFYKLAFTFPRDVGDDYNGDDDDDDDDDGGGGGDDGDKAVTINQFCNLKWKYLTMDCGRWD